MLVGSPVELESMSTTLPPATTLVAKEASSSSPSPMPRRLAAKVKLIDGVISRVLHRGDILSGEQPNANSLPRSGTAKQADVLYNPSLNAGLLGGAL